VRGGDGNLYRYAANDPLDAFDPSGLAVVYVGGTISGTAWGWAWSVGAGYMTDSAGNAAIYVNPGEGTGHGDRFSWGVTVGASNANTVDDMAGPFLNASAGYGAVAGQAYLDPSHPATFGGEITIGPEVGGGFSLTASNTYLFARHQTPDIADPLYDWLHPEDKQPAYDPMKQPSQPCGDYPLTLPEDGPTV
jgi:hypothetical protein